MQIIVLIILILINAYFAATEIAFISLNDAKINLMAKEGNKKAKKIAKMLKSPSKFLSTIQIGITLAGFLSSAFAADAFASELAPILNNIIPSIPLGVWNTIALILITMILSYFTIIFGELVPKRIGMKYCEQVAFGTIGIIRVISFLTAPFVKILTISTNIVSKVFGVSESEEETVTEEEIRMMVDVGGEKGTIATEEKEMINNVFEFNNRAVSEIMVYRTDIFAIELNTTISELEESGFDYRYSRIPVYEDTIDNIKGIIYMKDILRESKNKNTKVKKLMREAYFVPETKMINELFKELQKAKIQIAIVLDEYGGTAGMATMEDVLEELVGDIYDEYDEVQEMYKKVDDKTYIFDASIPIYELEKILEVDIPEGDYDTLSGFLLDELDRIPKENEKPVVELNSVTFKIEKYSHKRIMKVKAIKKEIPTDDENENEEEDENSTEKEEK